MEGTGPNWIQKQKPEIVLPQEEVVVKPNDDAKNNKGQASNTSKNPKAAGLQSNDADDQQNVGTSPTEPPKR